jgi:hypothetical protein
LLLWWVLLFVAVELLRQAVMRCFDRCQLHKNDSRRKDMFDIDAENAQLLGSLDIDL